MTSYDTSLLEPHLNIESSQIKQDYNCSNLNFPFKFNKETIKTELFGAVQRTPGPQAPTTTRPLITAHTNNVNSSNAKKTVAWLDHNKMTTLLIFLILVVVVVMVCVGLKLCMPQNFFRKFFLVIFNSKLKIFLFIFKTLNTPDPERVHKVDENNLNDIQLVEMNNNTIPNGNHLPNETHSFMISNVLTNRVQAEQQMKLLTVNTNGNCVPSN